MYLKDSIGSMNLDFTLTGLYLSSLSLDHNRLTILPLGLFTGCPLLQDLALNNNYLDDIPSDISGLSKLRTLDLGENRIANVVSQQLENLSSLYGLRLAGIVLHKMIAYNALS